MTPLVTALIDTYNHERYIEQALVSVLEQGFSAAELEVIVVDDGSTDETPSVIRKLVPRVKHLRKKNGGQASAFNAGFGEARGEVIAILDGDDWWEKGKLVTVVEVLEKHPEASAVGHAYYEFHESTGEKKLFRPKKTTKIDLTSPKAARLALRLWRFLLMGALTLRRTVLERILPLPKSLVFSADNPVQFAAMAMGAMILREPLSCYRIHQQNLYAITPENTSKIRRKYEMTDLAFRHSYRMLINLGVTEECVSTLLSGFWLENRRARLKQFGGNPVHTFQAEMHSFHITNKNPSLRYLLYKYFVMGAATLLLPPRQFYRLRDWYAQKQLGRYRDRLFKADVRPPSPPR